MADTRRSEDIYGEKVDRCLYNAIVKVGGGVAIGIVFSALLFKRKPWPVIFIGGLGSGMAFSDCNHEFASSDQPPKTSSTKSKILEGAKSFRSGLVSDSFGTGRKGFSWASHDVDSAEKTANGDGKNEKSCLCKTKEKLSSASSAKSFTKNKPFPCLSDGYEKRNPEDP